MPPRAQPTPPGRRGGRGALPNPRGRGRGPVPVPGRGRGGPAPTAPAAAAAAPPAASTTSAAAPVQKRSGKPSRFIDAAKRGADDLLAEYWNDPEKNIDPNKVDPIGQTALHWAARAGHYSTIQLLLSYGSSPTAVDNMGDTPLHKAAFGSHASACQLLLDAGADRDIVNGEGRIAMDLTEDRGTRMVLAPPQLVEGPDKPFEQDDSDSD